MSDKDRINDEKVEIIISGQKATAGDPSVVAVPEDPTAPSKEVSSKRQSLSDIFTIVS